MVQKAKKQPVTIEFVQWNNINYDEISAFIGQTVKPELESETAYVAGVAPPIFSITIPTLEGNMKAMPGDYIIKGVKGEFYPCKPDIFLASYTICAPGSGQSAESGDTANRPTRNLNFSQALQEMKEGSKLQRSGWNGVGMWVKTFSKCDFFATNFTEGETIAHKDLIMVDKAAKSAVSYPVGDCLCMKTAQGTFELGWRPTSMDMLAEDWQTVE